MYAGIPVWLCSDPDCGTVNGVFAGLLAHVPFNGWFVWYEPSFFGLGYFKCLWKFLTGSLPPPE